MGVVRNPYRMFVEKPKGKRLDTDRRIILKLILEEHSVKMWSGLISICEIQLLALVITALDH
jgi:hypothetical protein